MADITISGPDITLGGRYLDSGSGGGTGPKITVRLGHWLAGTRPPADPGDPLGPGGRWKAFKAWVKSLVGLK